MPCPAALVLLIPSRYTYLRPLPPPAIRAAGATKASPHNRGPWVESFPLDSRHQRSAPVAVATILWLSELQLTVNR
ncbi:hypothetical protein ABZP36_007781 [Zizania latifolia]